MKIWLGMGEEGCRIGVLVDSVSTENNRVGIVCPGGGRVPLQRGMRDAAGERGRARELGYCLCQRFLFVLIQWSSNSLEKLHAESAGVTTVIANREHAGKVKGECRIFNIEMIA